VQFWTRVAQPDRGVARVLLLTITEHVFVEVVLKWAEEKRKSVQSSGIKNGKASPLP